jgi:hypothetical protein
MSSPDGISGIGGRRGGDVRRRRGDQQADDRDRLRAVRAAGHGVRNAVIGRNGVQNGVPGAVGHRPGSGGSVLALDPAELAGPAVNLALSASTARHRLDFAISELLTPVESGKTAARPGLAACAERQAGTGGNLAACAERQAGTGGNTAHSAVSRRQSGTLRHLRSRRPGGV